MLPDEFGGHRSHEVVLEGKILSGDTELRSDLVHDSWLIAGTVPWLSELVESAAFAVLFAPEKFYNMSGENLLYPSA